MMGGFQAFLFWTPFFAQQTRPARSELDRSMPNIDGDYTDETFTAKVVAGVVLQGVLSAAVHWHCERALLQALELSTSECPETSLDASLA